MDAQTFHGVFEVAYKYLKIVKLAYIRDNYDDSRRCLCPLGLSDYTITKDRDLILVFNLSKKKGSYWRFSLWREKIEDGQNALVNTLPKTQRQRPNEAREHKNDLLAFSKYVTFEWS